MQRAEDFQTPVVTPNPSQEAEYQDEWTPRYGILVGGFPVLQWNGIGEESVGHHLINRRIWLPFVRIEVGRRNEFDGALDMPESTLTTDWSKSEARKKWKSPRACAGDVLNAFRSQGFCTPKVLIGHPSPQSLTDRVWPREIRDKYRLFEQIQYFETFTPQTKGENDEAIRAREKEAGLANDLLAACYASRDSVSEYVRTLKTEVEGEKGLKNLNDSLKELFYEIGEPLPEQKTALVASAMGKEIVEGVKKGDKTDKLLEAMMAQTAALQEQNRLLEQKINQQSPSVKGEIPDGSEASETQTSNTSTRRRTVAAKE